jgi:hypothetical protein
MSYLITSNSNPFVTVEEGRKNMDINGIDGHDADARDSDSDSDSDSLATEYGYISSTYQYQPTENDPLLFRPKICRQKLADTLLNADKQLTQSRGAPLNQKLILLTGERGVCVLSIFILLCLVFGIIDYLNSMHNTTIVYGTIGTYLFLIYYLINVCWYGIFTIIHIFLVSTQLFYTINRTNYVECIVLNYRHFYYNYLIKILFVSVIILDLFLDMNYTITSIPLYYNIIIIELVLSSLLYLFINKIINNYDFIKNMNNNDYITPDYAGPIYAGPIYVGATEPIYSV